MALTPVLDAAADLVRHHPGRARPKTGWPCCEFVGRVVLAAAGADAPPGWWAKMCVHSPDWPWSPLDAAAELVGLAGPLTAPGRLVLPGGIDWGDTHVDAVLRGCVAGRWHVAQRWTRLSPDGTARGLTSGGHTVLLWYEGDGLGCILESDVRRGVRFGGTAWAGGAPPRPEPLLPWLLACRAGVAVQPLWAGA